MASGVLTPHPDSDQPLGDTQSSHGQDVADKGVAEVASSTSPQAAPAGNRPGWVESCRSFLRHHRRPLNLALHLITTPLSLVGLVSIGNVLSPPATLIVLVVYALALCLLIPWRTFLATSLTLALIAVVAQVWQAGIWGGAALFVVGYIGQELAHWICGESTLQSSYIGKQNWLGRLAEHTFLLLPLILVTAGRRKQSPLRLFVSPKAVLKTKLTGNGEQNDLAAICQWVAKESPELHQSNHWWQDDLEGDSGAAFGRLSQNKALMSMIRRHHGTGYEVKPVFGMNELYVTGPKKTSTSDTVFYMGHVDGPWAVFPGARLYRCMVAASPNAEVTTWFPMVGTDYRDGEGHRLESGDAVAFDFNRELHYITRQPVPEQTNPRINLKLHFVAYPKALPAYGGWLDRLTTSYDIKARNLFLATIDPSEFVQKVKAKWVLAWTKIFELVVRFVGWSNLALVAVLGVISLGLSAFSLSGATFFLATTSFIHYFIYLGTLQQRRGISFGEFRRNATFFKTLSLAQLVGLYVYHFSGQFISLAIVTISFMVATYSMGILGGPRTYFSWELGLDLPKRIKQFPYGTIPHPMILSAVVAIAAMAMVPGIRQNYAWLIAGHVLMYVVVLIQEIATQEKLSANG